LGFPQARYNREVLRFHRPWKEDRTVFHYPLCLQKDSIARALRFRCSIPPPLSMPVTRPCSNTPQLTISFSFL
jgi:hypothetical protein